MVDVYLHCFLFWVKSVLINILLYYQLKKKIKKIYNIFSVLFKRFQ